MDHTATLLPGGDVLIIGGGQGTDSRKTAERFDHRTGQFHDAGALITPRSSHQATLLPDGGVLVTGGWGDHGEIAAAELWDAKTETFHTAGTMATPRTNHTATRLTDDSVLVAGGGLLGGSLETAELWRGDCACFRALKPMRTAHELHSATRLADGRVVVVGGFSAMWRKLPDGSQRLVQNGSTSAVEIFDLASESWSDGGSLSAARMTHEAVLLKNGNVALLGGQIDTDETRKQSNSVTSSVEIWNPATKRVATGRAMLTARSGFVAARPVRRRQVRDPELVGAVPALRRCPARARVHHRSGRHRPHPRLPGDRFRAGGRRPRAGRT